MPIHQCCHGSPVLVSTSCSPECAGCPHCRSGIKWESISGYDYTHKYDWVPFPFVLALLPSGRYMLSSGCVKEQGYIPRDSLVATLLIVASSSTRCLGECRCRKGSCLSYSRITIGGFLRGVTGVGEWGLSGFRLERFYTRPAWTLKIMCIYRRLGLPRVPTRLAKYR